MPFIFAVWPGGVEPRIELLAFSPDSKLLALAPTMAEVRLVDPATLGERTTLQTPERLIPSALAFSANVDLLAVATLNCKIELWDLKLIRQNLAELGWTGRSVPAKTPGRRSTKLASNSRSNHRSC
jgi:hypothetical protein